MVSNHGFVGTSRFHMARATVSWERPAAVPFLYHFCSTQGISNGQYLLWSSLMNWPILCQSPLPHHTHTHTQLIPHELLIPFQCLLPKGSNWQGKLLKFWESILPLSNSIVPYTSSEFEGVEWGRIHNVPWLIEDCHQELFYLHSAR